MYLLCFGLFWFTPFKVTKYYVCYRLQVFFSWSHFSTKKKIEFNAYATITSFELFTFLVFTVLRFIQNHAFQSNESQVCYRLQVFFGWPRFQLYDIEMSLMRMQQSLSLIILLLLYLLCFCLFSFTPFKVTTSHVCYRLQVFFSWPHFSSTNWALWACNNHQVL